MAYFENFVFILLHKTTNAEKNLRKSIRRDLFLGESMY